MLRSDLCDFSDAYIFVKGVTAVTNPVDAKRIMHHLSIAFQKLIVYKLTAQKT